MSDPTAEAASSHHHHSQHGSSSGAEAASVAGRQQIRNRVVEPMFHPQLRRTKEVIRRPEWVRRSGEAVAHRGSLNAVALFGILFANCIGGGYGFEDGIGSAGPLITLIVCIILPWMWSLPTGLAVAELSTAVPSNSGVLMWANASLPPFLSFLCILGTIFVTFIGNATYPSLTSEYVAQLTPLARWQAELIKVAVVLICCVLNIVGVEIVGSACILMCAICILPFVLLTVIQLFGHGFNRALLYVDVKNVDWFGFISIISWNYANIENAGAVVEEVKDPQRNMPRAMVYLMFGSYVGYVMPMLAGVSAMGVGQDYSQWKAGHWPVVAEKIAGAWLKYILFSGAMLSGIGFTLTSMCCTSRLLAGMGTMEMFPKRVSRIIGYYHPRLGTPMVAIVINTVVTAIFCTTMNFENIVALCQSIYCLRLLVIYVAVIKLRVQYPRLPRPFHLPCNTWVAALCLLPAALFSLFAAIMSAGSSFNIGMALVGFVVGGSAVSWVYCRLFAKNGFQGVIVQCEVSDDDGEDPLVPGSGAAADPFAANASLGGGGDRRYPGSEGVFYHEGQDMDAGDLLLGILPTAVHSPTGDGDGVSAGAEEAGGAAAGGGGGGGGRRVMDGSGVFERSANPPPPPTQKEADAVVSASDVEMDVLKHPKK